MKAHLSHARLYFASRLLQIQRWTITESQNITIYHLEQCNEYLGGEPSTGSPEKFGILCQRPPSPFWSGQFPNFLRRSRLTVLIKAKMVFKDAVNLYYYYYYYYYQNGFRGCSEPVQIFLRMQWTCTNKHPWAGSRRDRGLRRTWFRGSFDGWGCVEGIRKYRMVFFYCSVPKRSKCHIP